MSDGVLHDEVDPGQARVAARLFAGRRVLQGAHLRPHSTTGVFAAFRAGRLAGDSDVFGALPAGCDLIAAVARAQLH